MSEGIKDIEEYLKEVKHIIKYKKWYIAEKNRIANQNLFDKYVIGRKQAEAILLDLNVFDFVEMRVNEHQDYKHEKLYIFGKNVNLLEKYGNEYKTVPLYIKLNKVDESLVIVVSFHEQMKSINYCFK